MSSSHPGQAIPDWHHGASGGDAGLQALTDSGSPSAPSPFDSVVAPPASEFPPARGSSKPGSSTAATVASAALLVMALLGGLFAALAGAARTVSGIYVSDGLITTVNYTPFVVAGGFVLAWVFAVVVGVGVVYCLRGSWLAMLAPVGAAVTFGTLVVIAFLASRPFA